MRLSITKENGTYVTRIWHKHDLMFVQDGYSSREAATLDAWVNALFIRDISTACEQSVEDCLNGF